MGHAGGLPNDNREDVVANDSSSEFWRTFGKPAFETVRKIKSPHGVIALDAAPCRKCQHRVANLPLCALCWICE